MFERKRDAAFRKASSVTSELGAGDQEQTNQGQAQMQVQVLTLEFL